MIYFFSRLDEFINFSSSLVRSLRYRIVAAHPCTLTSYQRTVGTPLSVRNPSKLRLVNANSLFLLALSDSLVMRDVLSRPLVS